MLVFIVWWTMSGRRRDDDRSPAAAPQKEPDSLQAVQAPQGTSTGSVQTAKAEPQDN
jgi:hypothetical protein